MSDDQIPDDVTIEMDRDIVAATTTVNAPPAEVFDYIRRPANHSAISGDETVKGTAVGPDILSDGDRFGMRMKMYGVPYKVTSKVVEFQQGTRLAWCHMGGHRWRWDLEDAPGGGTRLTETFDLSTAKVPAIERLMGYPKNHRPNVARSVANVAAHFTDT